MDTSEVVNLLWQLSIDVCVKDSNFTNPNSRAVTVRLLFGDQEVSSSTTYFDVVQKREYEG